MLARTNTGEAFFFAGHVPSSMAERLRNNAELGAAASLHSISGSVNLNKGLGVHADLDLGSDADASTLAASVTSWLSNLQKNGQVQMLGLSSYLDTITVSPRKSTFVFDLRMTDSQVDDLATRLAGFSRTLAF